MSIHLALRYNFVGLWAQGLFLPDLKVPYAIALVQTTF